MGCLGGLLRSAPIHLELFGGLLRRVPIRTHECVGGLLHSVPIHRGPFCRLLRLRTYHPPGVLRRVAAPQLAVPLAREPPARRRLDAHHARRTVRDRAVVDHAPLVVVGAAQRARARSRVALVALEARLVEDVRAAEQKLRAVAELLAADGALVVAVLPRARRQVHLRSVGLCAEACAGVWAEVRSEVCAEVWAGVPEADLCCRVGAARCTCAV
eukprot:364607-Chlamydomonas_euryale.AAC.6